MFYQEKSYKAEIHAFDIRFTGILHTRGLL